MPRRPKRVDESDAEPESAGGNSDRLPLGRYLDNTTAGCPDAPSRRPPPGMPRAVSVRRPARRAAVPAARPVDGRTRGAYAVPRGVAVRWGKRGDEERRPRRRRRRRHGGLPVHRPGGQHRAAEAHPAAYREAVRRHHALLREAVEGHGGWCSRRRGTRWTRRSPRPPTPSEGAGGAGGPGAGALGRDGPTAGLDGPPPRGGGAPGRALLRGVPLPLRPARRRRPLRQWMAAPHQRSRWGGAAGAAAARAIVGTRPENPPRPACAARSSPAAARVRPQGGAA